MKKIFALALILTMVFCCAACGSGGDKDLLAEIKEQGFAPNPTSPPMSSLTPPSPGMSSMWVWILK